MKKILVSAMLIFSMGASAQVGIGTLTPAATSILDLTSTTQGFLVPRMTAANKATLLAIPPAAGMLIYQTDATTGFYYFDGTAFIGLPNSGILSKVEGTNFTGSLILGHQTTGTLTTAYYNTAVGIGSLPAITSGPNNTATGYNTLNLNTTGYSNVANGYSALTVNVGGFNNIAVGAVSLTANTSGNHNTGVGHSSLTTNTTGIKNTAIGAFALNANTDGYTNTAIGQEALYGNTSGFTNTALGYQAGLAITTGSNLTCIGFDAEASAVNATNQITLGNSSVGSLRCQVTSITSLSDRRDKAEIKTITEGIDFVKKLNPVTYTWNTRDKAKVGIKAAGFIAQELLELQKNSKIGDNLDLVSTDNPEKLEARYGNLLPIMVKAIQDQQKIIELQEQKINALEKSMAQILNVKTDKTSAQINK